MILPWIYDYNTKRLTLTINDNLSYEALDGGVTGYIKTVDGESIKLDNSDWENEKRWISNNFKDQFGEYQPLHGEFMKLPNGSTVEFQNGKCPEGTRLDHLQRPATLMTWLDLAEVFVKGTDVFETPDNGKTIYLRPSIKAEDTNYIQAGVGKVTQSWPEVPQPCHMQPRIQGRRLSSHSELEAAGAPKDTVDKCKEGKWADAPRPHLQKLYVYPR